MYLARLNIEGFRRLGKLELCFKQGLNVIVGPNNAGKTAVVDALRVLLSTGEEGALRLSDLDLHVSAAGEQVNQATFTYVFRGLNQSEEADFFTALKPLKDTKGNVTEYEAYLTVQYSKTTNGDRLRVKRWAGDHEENPVTSEMLEDLRTVYLPPLRDPAQGLKPGRFSQLARLVQRLSSEESREEMVAALTTFDTELRSKKPIADAQDAITRRHTTMLGHELSQELSVNLSPSDFRRVTARLALLVADFEVEQNGLGFNNLIYMAVVLSELSLATTAAYAALIVEEPEAHLHPQLQAVLLEFLKSVEKPKEGEKAVQVFVTSHSPNFAALAELDSLTVVYSTSNGVASFSPREVEFEPGKKEKLQRYLNVTRAEIFFARRIIFVEGAAELFVIEALAKKSGADLRKHSVSLISTDGLNFDAFLPLFGGAALQIPVSVVTDADPPTSTYPAAGSPLSLSANAEKLRGKQDTFMKAFFAQKTLEYDMALQPKNIKGMLKALEEIHPTIGKTLAKTVEAGNEAERAKLLFSGMFERGEGKTAVQKGAYGQALAEVISNKETEFVVPQYILEALQHVTSA